MVVSFHENNQKNNSFFAIFSLYETVMKECERGSFFQLKVYERRTFPVKKVYDIRG